MRNASRWLVAAALICIGSWGPRTALAQYGLSGIDPDPRPEQPPEQLVEETPETPEVPPSYAPPSQANGADDEDDFTERFNTGFLWGGAAMEVSFASGLAALLTLQPDDDTALVAFMAGGSLAIGALAGILGGVLDLPRSIPRALHMGLWSGGAALLTSALIADGVDGTVWAISSVTAGIGALIGGLFVNTEVKDQWSLAGPIALMGWLAALVCTFPLAFGLMQTEAGSAFLIASVPTVLSLGVLTSWGMALFGEEPDDDAPETHLSVGPGGVSATMQF